MSRFTTTNKMQRDAKAGKFVMPTKFDKITAWSFSLYRRYKGCPRQVALERLKLDKMENKGMQAGIDMHTIAENYVGKKTKSARVPSALLLVADHAKALRNDPTTQVEMQQAFTKGWALTDWFDPRNKPGTVWVRIKVDARRILEQAKTRVKVVEITDWKGGRPNAFFDTEQAELYALGEFYYSGAQEVRTKFAHTDTGDETDGVFTIKEQPSLRKEWEKRTKKLLNDQRFDATPGGQCSWCPFSKKHKGGICGAG